jgi:hypothetical protein
MKIYIMSVMAFLESRDHREEPIGTIVEHFPAIVLAGSMATAAEGARTQALERWKVDEGWSQHQAAIMVATEPFCESVDQALELDQLDMTDEPPQVFRFESSPMGES